MPGNLSTILSECPKCHHKEELTTDEVPPATPVACPECGAPMGPWSLVRWRSQHHAASSSAPRDRLN